MVFQTRDVIDAMTKASGVPLSSLRVDGGAAVMDLLCQLQANQLNVNVMRPTVLETTAMGAAYLAGLAEGVWNSTKDIADAWHLDRRFEPQPTGTETSDHTRWLRGVERSLKWQQ
jgi:glycerol kinase